MKLVVDGRPNRSSVKDDLTTREVETLCLLARGHTSQAIADRLCLSKRTIDFHLANIYGKLGVSNRVQALLVATSAGLIPNLRPFGSSKGIKPNVELELVSNDRK